MFNTAKRRAKDKGVDFNLDISDIVIPSVCPVLGIPLAAKRGCVDPASPSLDRIIPSKGYVKGNVQVISHRANSIKSNATIEEVEMVLNYMKGADPCQTTIM